jgi:hypothetical protein
MYELKKIGNVFTSKFVGTGPSFYKKRVYRAAVSQRLRNTDIDDLCVLKCERILKDASVKYKTRPCSLKLGVTCTAYSTCCS